MLFLAALALTISASPNIVLVLADDLGYGDPGCYHAESRIATPHIDRLAAAGMRFTDAHTPSAVCTPTRYGLLTGRYPWRSQLKRGVLDGYSRALIEPDRPTLATFLTAAGYHTACVGKWHLGLGPAEPADYRQAFSPGLRTAGFARSFILPASLDMPPYVFVENDRATEFPSAHIAASQMRRHGGGGFWREGARAPGFRIEDALPAITDRACQYIASRTSASRAADSAPFFLYVPLTAPHTPWMPTSEFRGRTLVDYYGDFVAQVDDTLGRILAALDEHRLADNTLVIFTSDNGAHWTPDDIARWQHRANGPWRGQKADLWEGGHRVPFIVRWPGRVQPGTASDQLICLTDCFATLAEALDRPLPAGAAEDSISFRAALTAAPPQTPPRDTVIHQAADGTLAIRHGPWKFAPALGSHGFSTPRTLDPEPGAPATQLYNLFDDPAETTNLSATHPERAQELAALLTKLTQPTSTPPAP